MKLQLNLPAQENSCQFHTHYSEDGKDDDEDEMRVMVMSCYTLDGWTWMCGVVRYSQLSSCRVHTCLSMGYLVRSMLQAIVAVMLQCIYTSRSLEKQSLMLYKVINNQTPPVVSFP